MDATLLGSLSAFLRTLSTAPHPDEVARALVDVFAEPFDARSASILIMRGRHLVVFGVHGYPDDEVTAIRAMPVDGGYPLSRALREGEAIIDRVSDVSERYAAGRRAGGSWARTRARLPEGSVASVPIISGGLPVGGYALLFASQREWAPTDVALLDAIGHALGMWLTHPDSGLPADEPIDPASLTSRQVAVLSLVALGRSNSEIGDLLGYSESTVKQEMQRILRSLEAGSRQEAASRAAALGLLDEAAERAST